MIKKKISYVTLALDILHKGHLNIIKIAKKYEELIIGILTYKAIFPYKDLTTTFEADKKNISLNEVINLIKND